jgi:SOS-response transcriptional repressor LexA
MVLTKKQQQVLDFTRKFLNEHGYSPSYREVMAGLGIKSISTVSEHIENLVKKSYLVKKDGSARSLEPIEPPTSFAGVDPAKKHAAELAETRELFRVKLAELNGDKPETAIDRAALERAAELLNINLS